MLRICISVFVLLLGTLCLGSVAHAENFVITSGYWSVTGQGGSPTFHLAGTGVGGTTLTADGTSTRNSFPPVQARSCNPCTAGSLLNIGVNSNGFDYTGSTTIGGSTIPVFFLGSGFQFTGTPVLTPTNGSSTITLTIPFFYNVQLEMHPNDPFIGNPGPTLFTLSGTGQGLATFILTGSFDPGLGWLYSFQSARYDIVPEPASVLLLGSGLAALALYALRKRSDGSLKSD